MESQHCLLLNFSGESSYGGVILKTLNQLNFNNLEITYTEQNSNFDSLKIIKASENPPQKLHMFEFNTKLLSLFYYILIQRKDPLPRYMVFYKADWFSPSIVPYFRCKAIPCSLWSSRTMKVP